MFDLKSKRCIVTGSGQGIGKAIAELIVKAGGKVCVSDLPNGKGAETAHEFRDKFGLQEDSICFVACDISKKDQWSKMWNEAEAKLGGTIDLLCNNAGIVAKRSDDPELSLEVNAIGTSYGCFLAVERMGKSRGGKGGRIVNIGSKAGLMICPRENYFTPYTMSKYGVVALTRCFAWGCDNVEESEGIKCFCLCPDIVDTQLTRFLFDDDGKPLVVGSDKFTSIDDFKQKTNYPVMKPSDIAQAFQKALAIDKNGSVFLVAPELPMMEFMLVDNVFFNFNEIVAKLGKKMGLEVIRPWHVLTALFLSLFICLWILMLLISTLF